MMGGCGFCWMNGYQICRALRQEEDWTPILMLTAKDGEWDEADSLDAGADDFLSKPFSFVVLLARLRALARRAAVARPVVLQAGDLVFDVAASSVRRGATEIGLSRREMDVLEVLMRSDGAPVAKREIFNRVWGFDAEVDSNVVEVYIRYLRRMLLVARDQQEAKGTSSRRAAGTSRGMERQSHRGCRRPVPDSGDEIAELAELMNEMLDRLQAASDRQRAFTADASHELRAPLSTLLAAAEVAEVSSDPQKLQELSAKIGGEARRMQALISDLLDLARLDEQRREELLHPVDLWAACEHAVERVDGQDVAVTLAGAAASPIVGVESQIERAVFNLVDNAVAHADQHVLITLVESAAAVAVVVEDDGPGIPAEDRVRVLDQGTILKTPPSRGRIKVRQSSTPEAGSPRASSCLHLHIPALVAQFG